MLTCGIWLAALAVHAAVDDGGNHGYRVGCGVVPDDELQC